MKYLVHLVTAITLVLVFVFSAYGHPTNTPHSHNDTNVFWELDGDKDGSSAHNHMFNRNFGGDNSFREPYAADGCWDDGVWRNTEIVDFDQGHCYVDGLDPLNVVTYDFVTSIPSGAKSRIREAFDKWSALSTFFTLAPIHGVQGNSIGIEYQEGSLGADINVHWTNINDGLGGGVWSDLTAELYFDSSFDWDFSKTFPEVDDSKHHFASVALHEVGHAVGLEHQLDFGDDVMAPPVGLPGTSGNRNLFFEIDGDSAQGAYELYGQTPSTPPPPACNMTVYLQYCQGQNANFAMTAKLPGFNVTLADYDISFGNGPWTDVYEGVLICPSVVGQGEALGRAILQTLGGSSQCEAFIQFNVCGNQNPL